MKTKAPELNFTDERLSKIQPPLSGRQFYRDAVVPGLMLQVTNKNNRCFCSVKRVGGRPRRKKYGDVGQLTISEARKAAIDWLENPGAGQERKPTKPPETKRTIGRVFEDLLKEEKDALRPSTVTQYGRIFKREIKNRGLADKELSSITRADIREMRSNILERFQNGQRTRGSNFGRTAANRLVAFLIKLFNFEDLPHPCGKIKKLPEYKRERFLREPAEIARFLAAIESDPSRTFRDAIMLALLTGARIGNICSAEWEEMHLDHDPPEWIIPAHKSKNHKQIHALLVPRAVEILRTRELIFGHAKWVFPSQKTASGHMGYPVNAWIKLRTKAQLPDLKIHDLRRTFGSWQAITGASLLHVAESLGQSGTSATATYARLRADSAHAGILNATQTILGFGTGKPDARKKPKGK